MVSMWGVLGRFWFYHECWVHMFVSYKFNFSNTITIVREMANLDIWRTGWTEASGSDDPPGPSSFVRRGCHGQVPVDAARLSGSLGQRPGANLLPNIAAISSIFLGSLIYIRVEQPRPCEQRQTEIGVEASHERDNIHTSWQHIQSRRDTLLECPTELL